MVVHEITDRLDPSPTRRSSTKQTPGRIGKPLSVAVSAAQEKDQTLLRQILYRMLVRRSCDDIGLTGILEEGRARYPDLSFGSDETGAPVAEAIAIVG